MKAIIVAAGKGNRLMPLTREIPKPLLKINHETILEHQIHNLTASGINDIVIVTGYRSKQIEEVGGPGIKYIYNPYYETSNSLVSLWFARNEFNDDFIYLHADVVFDRRILEKLMRQPEEICIAVEKKPCVLEDMKVRTNGEEIIEINKTMELSRAYGEFIGLARFSRKGSAALTQELDIIVKEGDLMFWFESSLQRLIDQGQKVNKCETGDLPWVEIDFAADLEKGRAMFHRLSK